jgi:hypothetical protein
MKSFGEYFVRHQHIGETQKIGRDLDGKRTL